MSTRKQYCGKDGELHIRELPLEPLQPGFVAIKPRALAVNPTDYKHVKFEAAEGLGAGLDYSGDVVEVGPGVTNVKVGDTVAGAARAYDSDYPNDGAYSTLIIEPAATLIKFPKKLVSNPENRIASGPVTSYEQAASLGIGVGTSILAFEWNNKFDIVKNSKSGYALIYGAASSLGFQALQLAHYVGYKIIAVASKKHTDILTKVGAAHVLDYHDEDWVQQAKKIGGDDIVYAYDTISVQETFEKVYEAVSSTKPTKINLSLFDLKTPEPSKPQVTVDSPLLYFLFTLKKHIDGGLTLEGDARIIENAGKYISDVNRLIAENYFHSLPIDVVGKGFDEVPALFTRYEKGISGEKAVIRLD